VAAAIALVTEENQALVPGIRADHANLAAVAFPLVGLDLVQRDSLRNLKTHCVGDLATLGALDHGLLTVGVSAEGADTTALACHCRRVCQGC